MATTKSQSVTVRTEELVKQATVEYTDPLAMMKKVADSPYASQQR